MLPALAFYLFAFMTLFAAVMVITTRNHVHAVLFLVLAFFNAAGLFVLLGAEFIAMILVIVYVGAVAVLFMFVVMMLDISFANLREWSMRYVPTGILIGGLLLSELVVLYGAWEFAPGAAQEAAETDLSNTESLGALLYTKYIYAFQASGLILLVAMIGAIVLTHRRRSGVRRQVIGDQQSRKASDVLEVKKVTPRTGV